jgi:hypothetical protein
VLAPRGLPDEVAIQGPGAEVDGPLVLAQTRRGQVEGLVVDEEIELTVEPLEPGVVRRVVEGRLP